MTVGELRTALEANAALIVHRVNSWDRLVEALEKIEAEVFPHPREVHLYIDRIRGLAADALTEARSQHEGR